MSFLKSPEFKVGLLVVLIGGLIAFMSMQVSDDPSYLGRSKKAWFLLPSAQGLVKGSAIKSAGIPVGVIKDIRLQDGQARIDVTVKSDVSLTRSAAVAMKANGILGDKSVEIFPGNVGDPELEDGGQILNVKSGGGLDDVMGQITELAGSLKEVSKNLQEAVSENGTDKHVLGRIVLNIEKLTADLSQMTGENKEQISQIIAEVGSITSTLDELINDESEQGFKSTWKHTMSRLDNSMKNIEEITTKINNGQGTIGKLISDEQTAEDVSSAIEGLSGLVGAAERIETGVDFNGYYLSEAKGTRTSVGITIQPGLDRYYYVGVVTDPAGVVETTEYNITPGGGGGNSYTETKTFKSKSTFTVYFAKNFFDWTLRAGLFENTGGFGIDYHMLGRNLKAGMDFYDFEKLQMRATLNYRLFYGLYLTAGYNDILDKKGAQSNFFGAGIYLTNDDLKLLLTRAPF
ncbi:MlaD family protein [Pseudobdellovibrio exovorus]|uniref:ABC-type organic solvent transporter, solute-binding periplasmic protein n=1 Tax=Pseudobdellovibrio exovorus JSS TaxID=1184267 RepID=M4VAD6_9BACT|nr:MlaD family protein [Pseudobdellovibrio exovorus]AGH96188.1 ABC-type organic solvent transporter, solute-binding periplasmic protein [Pseudobdellovibrio exovorus JSS]